jgi:outer membrane receptor protein involved in Fe transport
MRPIVALGKVLLIGSVLGAGLSATPALAQSAPRAEDPVSLPVDEIVVTARKREESLQEVPLSITAFSADQLQALGIRSDYDVANFTIGYRTLQQTGRDIDRPVIRGMAAPSTRGEPNASYFIDGVFVSGSISTAVTSAVDRVEVLRGPQSAQFGRATFSGAINYVTKTPGEELEGQINSRAGTSDDYEIGGWASGPLIDGKLYFLVSGDWSKYGGQWRNSLAEDQASYELDTRLPFRQFLLNPPQEADHSRLGSEETEDFMGKLVWRPTEGSEVSLKYGYTHSDDTHFPNLIAADLNCYVPTPETRDEPWYATSQGYYCGEWNAEGKVNRINLPDLREGVTYILAPTFPEPQNYAIGPNEPGTFRDQNRVLLEYVQEIGGYTLTTRGAYNRDDFEQFFDLDHTQTRAVWGLFHFDNRRNIEDYSAELRLDSPGDLPVRGSLGLYYYDQNRENSQRSYVGPAVVFGAGNVTTAFPPSTFIDVANTAVFGAFDVDLSDQWTLVLEGRYAWDNKDLSGGALGTCDPLDPTLCTPDQVSADFSNFTPRVTLRYKPTDDLMLYLLTAKGNKPGDFNTEFFRSGIAVEAVLAGLNGCVPSVPPDVIPCISEPLAIVKEEEQWTYEIGAKATWLDGRLTTNLAAYYIDWTNQGLFTTINILQTKVPLSYLTTNVIRNVGKSEVTGLELETNFRVTDNFSLVANYGFTDSRFVEGEDPTTFATTGDGDISGNRVPSVPEHTVILGAYATAPLTSELTVFIRPDYVFNSRRYTSASNLAWIGNDVTLNFRMGIQADRWTVTGYVRNVLDDQTPVAALDFVNFGTVDVNYPVNTYGNLLNDRDPLLFSLNPKRGRDWGVELQYRF